MPRRPPLNGWSTLEHRFPVSAARSWKPTVTWSTPGAGVCISARRPNVFSRTLPSRRIRTVMSLRPRALVTMCFRSQNLNAPCMRMNLFAGTFAHRRSAPPAGRICRKTS